MKEYLHPPLREWGSLGDFPRVQKFKQEFCFSATGSRYCVKAELTFEPYILLMEG